MSDSMKILKILEVIEMDLEKQRYINKIELCKPMKNEVHLEEIVQFIDSFLVKLNVDFLRRLMISSSKFETPWRDEKFVNSLGYVFNKEAECAPAINKIFREGTALPLFVVKKMLGLSPFTWKDIEKYLISIRAGRRHGELGINFPILIDHQLGSIVGHILGDGSIDARYSQVFFTNQNEELAEEFYNNVKSIFGIEGRIWIQDSTYGNSKWIKRVASIKEVTEGTQIGLFYPSSLGIILHAILGKFADGRNKKITRQILGSNLEFKKGLIRAFFDDEGSIRSEDHLAKLHQDNEQLLKQIKQMISEFGIETNPLRDYYKKNKIRYALSISGYKNYYKFYHFIGCTSSKKRKEFELLIDKVKNSKHFKKKFSL